MRAAAIIASLALAATLAACSGPAQSEGEGSGESLTVFAAASLAEPMDELLDQFAADHPDVDVRAATYDGSSTLVTQLIEGADADVLATANTATMDDLVAKKPAVSPHLFASNTLVIAVKKGNPEGISSLADLADKKFVVCAPKVPCGAAAAKLFELAEFHGKPISQEQNVTAAAQRVETGAADAALVYRTDVASRADTLEAVIPPGADQVVNEYPIAALNENAATKEFVDLVRSERGQKILHDAGFGTP